METGRIDIKEIKRRGRTAFRANFLLCVFAALVMALVVEGSTNMFSSSSTSLSNLTSSSSADSTETGEAGTEEEMYTYTDETGEEVTVPMSELRRMYYYMQGITQGVMFLGGHLEGGLGMLLHMMVISGAGVFSVLFAFLISNVVEVGCCRFYLVNSKKKAYINEIFSYFKKGKYRRAMTIQMYRLAYVVSWGLLLVVPGVIKAYEYRLVPYLLADDVEIKLDETLKMSKELMNGHKKEAFLMDLSFLLWDILGVCSLGLLATFWVNPYKYASRAEFYAEIRRMNDASYTGTSGSSVSARTNGKDPFASYHAYQKKDKQ